MWHKSRNVAQSTGDSGTWLATLRSQTRSIADLR
jgi:hypothetical protein